MTTCTLCDLDTPDPPITDPDVDGAFCCRGCLSVYRALGDVDPDAVDGEDIAAPADDADVPEDADTAFLSVDGMHCTACEAFVEATAADHDGVYAADASYATEMLKVDYDDSALDEADLPDLVKRMGYRAAVPDVGTDASEEERFGRDEIRTVLGLGSMMVVMTLYAFFLYPSYLGIYPDSFLRESATRLMVFLPMPIVSTFALFVVGFPILRGAYVSLSSGRPNMDVLIAGGALAAWGYSMLVVAAGGTEVYFDVSTAIVGVVTLGDFLETRVKRRAVGRLGDLDFGRVREVTVRDRAGTHAVDLESVEPGDEFVVKRGDRIPLDGEVVDGDAAVDESLLTGEAAPRAVSPGDDVVGGTVPTDGRLVVRAGPDATSTYDRLLGQLWNLQSSNTRAQRLADTVAALFVPFVLGLAALTAAGWFLYAGSVEQAVVTGVSVLVVSCPCSFGLATPLAVAAGVDRAAEDGIVVTHAPAIESLPDVDVVALDKTGTLTTGEMTVTDVAAADPERVLRYAAAVERDASHPIADATVDAAEARGIDDALPEPSEFTEHPRGAEAVVDGHRVLVGHPALFGDDWTLPAEYSEAIDAAVDAGGLASVVGWGGEVRGVLTVSDTPRDGWQDAVERFATASGGSDSSTDSGHRGSDRPVVVVTGDDQTSLAAFDDHPAIADVFTGVLPEAKAAVVERLRAKHGAVAFVGDGTNDAPALAAADLGIAFASGTELASEAADATIVDGGLAGVERLFDHAETVKERVRSNIVWALGYNVITLPLAVAGLINPLWAAVAMAGSSIIVVLNSSRD
ncbi:heavy metal translocating P-type ATPase [Halocalculus aciditolerans]|uniref:Heavy metal translocating P-type ATPase n=1 Tax=Halocalculus aciditolerans TaxID=1383812 RepID=A0A830FBY5_9EURY|nr:cation-translocating P-type ATPase [Halocalculus aciditolerans]GGL59919.1 heavy metal translocating P-type ATPase [Halocalculus aciditolerans]